LPFGKLKIYELRCYFWLYWILHNRRLKLKFCLRLKLSNWYVDRCRMLCLMLWYNLIKWIWILRSRQIWTIGGHVLSWFFSPFPCVNMLKPCSFQFQNIKQEATEVQPKDLTTISQATTNTKHPVTSTVHTEAPHEPVFLRLKLSNCYVDRCRMLCLMLWYNLIKWIWILRSRQIWSIGGHVLSW
jgi:hypothetical protein